MKKQIIFLTCLTLFFSACSSAHLQLKSQYELPKNIENQNVELVKPTWWEEFKLQELNALVEQSLENNSDMLMALQKIEQAKLQLNIAQASYFPTIDASANTSSNKKREHKENYTNTESSTASLSMKYELDLWGKIRASNSIAQAALTMTQYDLDTIRLSLISTLVQTYFEYIANQEKIALTLETFENEKKELEIMQKKYELGSISALDLSKQKSSLLSYESTLATLYFQKQTLHSSLALLVGKPSQELKLQESSFEKIAVPKVSENLSSTLLLNRPDVAKAYEQIQSSNASIHMAFASQFPSFSLTGNAGQASVSLLSLSNPTTTLGLGLGLNLNLFDQSALKNQVKIEQSKAKENVENYKKVLLTALKEVEDSLNSVYTNNLQNELKESILQQEDKTLYLSQLQYEYGLIDFSSLLDAKKAHTQAKEAVVNQKLSYLSSLVTLQKSLSSSWFEKED
jgi:NodT family efflux transporter outer membrane factor (OMF) lipoprotein